MISVFLLSSQILFYNSEILKLTVFIFFVKSRTSTFRFLITQNKYGRAVCGMEKLFLEFTAVGDLGEK